MQESRGPSGLVFRAGVMSLEGLGGGAADDHARKASHLIIVRPALDGLFGEVDCGLRGRGQPGEDTRFVADQEQLELLKDVDAWNKWRENNPRLTPDLSGGDLGNADLRVADLVGANLSGATLLMANLNGADLRGANLSGANLVGARMVGVDIEDADLSSADLRTAEDLTQEQLDETRGNENTVLPEGLEPPQSWLAKAE